MTPTPDTIAAYLATRLPSTRDIKVSHLTRIPGGASRETWMFKAVWHTGEGRRSEELILRRDPPAGLLDTDRAAEFACYQAFAAAPGVPVPRVYWLELDATALGAPFFIMERVKEAEANPTAILQPHWDGVRDAIGRHMYEVLAAIHSFDWRSAPLEALQPAPAPEDCWRRELDRWKAVLFENELRPQPIARAAIRWLRANPPPPPDAVTVVHGDYRVGNVLYHHDGTIRAVIDWETAHLGDPAEDLAWSFMADWEWAGDGRKGGIIAEADALAAYAAAGGPAVDRAANAARWDEQCARLHWWAVLCGVKAQALWLSGARAFAEGRTADLMPAAIAWTFANREDRHLLQSLGRWAPHSGAPR